MTVVFIDTSDREHERMVECEAVPRKGEVVFQGRAPMAHKYRVVDVVWEMRTLPRVLVYLDPED